MRRSSACWILAALAAILAIFPPSARAQDRRKVRIDAIRVGFPSSLVDSQFKSGQWTPVYVDLTAGPDPIAHAKLTIEAVDTDDVRNNYTVDMPLMEPGESTTVMAFTKPGSESADIGISIRMDGNLIAAKADNYFPAIPLDHHLYLTLGGVPGLKRAVASRQPTCQRRTNRLCRTRACRRPDDLRRFQTAGRLKHRLDDDERPRFLDGVSTTPEDKDAWPTGRRRSPLSASALAGYVTQMIPCKNILP